VHKVKEIWNVDTSIRLTRDIKIILFILWVLLIPSKDGIEVVLGRVVISKFEADFAWIREIRVSNTCWLLNV
jgi:hypothetical protein